MVTTPVGESVVTNKVYRNCPKMMPNRVKHVDLVELNMVDFDVILGMNYLHACFTLIDYRTRLVNFNLPNEPVLEWKGGNSIPRGGIISFLKACRMMSKGFLYHKVRFHVLAFDIPPIESVPKVREFPEVFSNDLPGIPP